MYKKIITNFLPYLFVFLTTIYVPLDPDLGWHLRYGEYFFQNWQVLRDNIHSAEMTGFHWANISWGADILYYLFYNLGGFFGLSLAGAAIITLTFFFFSKAFELDYWEQSIIFPIILFFEQPVNINSFRGQLLSMLFFGILFFLLNRFSAHTPHPNLLPKGEGISHFKDSPSPSRERVGVRGISILYFVPFLFLVWANMHGLFLLGLGLFVVWEGLFLISEKTHFKHYLKLFIPVTILSFLATLIHPFGIGIYEDALLHLNNPLLKLVTEYGTVEELSVQWTNLIITAVLFIIGIFPLLLGEGRVRSAISKILPSIGIFSILYILSLWVRRYSWVMYYFLIPFIKPIANFLRPPKKALFISTTVIFLIYLLITIIIKQPFSQYTSYSWNDYCKTSLQCSPKAVEALRPFYKPGKTMTPYSWGGWMIWNYPEMKPSTDGRMHVWQDEKGYSAFEHDYNLAHGITDIDDSKYDVVLASKQRNIFKRLKTLMRVGKWKKVYEDGRGGIFLRQ